MYVLFVTLFSLLPLDIELKGPEFNTMQDCWKIAEHIARSPEVFNVRCQLLDK